MEWLPDGSIVECEINRFFITGFAKGDLDIFSLRSKVVLWYRTWPKIVKPALY